MAGSPPVPLGWRRVAGGRFLTFERAYLLGDGGRWTIREVVRHPGSVVVIPWDGERVALIEQYRHPAGRRVLELPAGKLDVAGEAPQAAARRECIEEVGLDPTRLTRMFGCFASPGYTDEFSQVFLAEGLTPVPPDPQGIEEEGSRIVWLEAVEFGALLDSGALDDAKTVAGLAALRERIR